MKRSHKRLAALLGAVILAATALTAPAQESSTPATAELQSRAYLFLHQGDSARDQQDWVAALKAYEDAAALYLEIQRLEPDFKPDIISYRIDYCRKQIEAVSTNAANQPATDWKAKYEELLEKARKVALHARSLEERLSTLEKAEAENAELRERLAQQLQATPPAANGADPAALAEIKAAQETLSRRLREVEGERGALADQLKTQTEALAVAERELARLRQQVASTGSGNEQALQALRTELDGSRQLINGLEAELARSKAAEKALASELAELRAGGTAENESLQALTAELNDTRRALAEASRAGEELKAKSGSVIQQMASEQQSLYAEMDLQRKRLLELEARVKTLDAQRADEAKAQALLLAELQEVRAQAQASLEALQRQGKTDLEEQIGIQNRLRQELSAAQTSIQELQAVQAASRNVDKQVQTLQQQLSREKARAESALAALQTDLDTTHREKAALVEALADAKNTLADKEAQLARHGAERKELVAKSEAARAELAQAGAREAALREELNLANSHAGQTTAQAQAEVKRLEAQTREAQATQERLQTEIRRAREDVSALQAALTGEQSLNQDLKRELAGLKTSQNEQQARIEELTTRLANVGEDTGKALSEKEAELAEQTAVAQELAAQTEAARSELAKAKAQETLLREELTAATDALNALKNQAGTTNADLERLQKAVDLEQDLRVKAEERLKLALDKSTTLEKALAEATATAESAKAALATLEGRQNKASESQARLQEEVKVLQAALTGEQSRNDDLKRELTKLRETQGRFDADAVQLRAQVATEKGERENAEFQLKKAREASEKLRAEAEAAEKAHKQAQATLTALQAEQEKDKSRIKDLTEQLARERATAEGGTAQQAKLVQELSAVQQRLSEATADAAAAKKVLAEEKEGVRALREALKAAEDREEALTAKLESSANRLAALEAKLMQANEQHAAEKTAKEKALVDLANAEAAVKRLQNDVLAAEREATGKVADLRKELDGVTRELSAAREAESAANARLEAAVRKANESELTAGTVNSTVATLREELRLQHETKKVLEVEHKQAMRELKELTEKYAVMVRDLRQAEDDRAQLTHLKKEFAATQERLQTELAEAAKRERGLATDLETARNNANAEKSALQARLAELQTSLQTLESSHRQSMESKDTAYKNLMNLVSTHDEARQALAAQVATLTSAQAETQAALNQAKGDAVQLQENRDALARKLGETEGKLSELLGAHESLTTQHKEAVQQVKRLEAELAKTVQEQTLTTAELNALRDTLQNVTGREVALSTEKGSLQKAMDETLAKVKASELRVKELTQALAEKERQVKSVSEESGRVSGELTKTRKELGDQQTALKKEQETVLTLRTRMAEQAKALEALQQTSGEQTVYIAELKKQEATLLELQQTYERQVAELNEARELAKEQQKRIAGLEAQSARMEEFQQQLVEEAEARKRAEDNIRQLAQHIGELRGELAAEKKARDDQGVELAQLVETNNQLKHYESEVKAAEFTLKELRASEQQARADLVKLKAFVTEVAERDERQKKVVEAMNQELSMFRNAAPLQQETIDTLTRDLAATREELASLRSYTEQATNRLVQLEQVEIAFQKNQAQFMTLDAQYRELADAYLLLQNAYVRATNEWSTVQGALNQLQDQIGVEKRAQVSLVEQLNQANGAVSDLQSRLSAAEASVANLAKAQQELASVRDLAEKLRLQNQELHSTSTKLEASLAEQSKALMALQKERDNLAARLQKEDNKTAAAVAVVQKKLDALDEKLRATQAERDQALATRDALSKENAEMSAKVEASLRQLLKAEATIEELSQRQEQIVSRVQRLLGQSEQE